MKISQFLPFDMNYGTSFSLEEICQTLLHHHQAKCSHYFAPCCYDKFAQAATHHAEALVNPKVIAKKHVTDFRYPRACRFRKHQI
jgi:hypothetical protein